MYPKKFLHGFFDCLFAHKNFPRLTHTKISPIYTRKNFPYIYTHKNFPTIFTLLLYLQLCYYLNNSLCLSAYLPMCLRPYVQKSQRNSRTLLPLTSKVLTYSPLLLLSSALSISLSCPHLPLSSDCLLFHSPYLLFNPCQSVTFSQFNGIVLVHKAIFRPLFALFSHFIFISPHFIA